MKFHIIMMNQINASLCLNKSGYEKKSGLSGRHMCFFFKEKKYIKVGLWQQITSINEMCPIYMNS